MLQERYSNTELETLVYPVPRLRLHGNAVVELKAGYVADGEHNASSKGPPEVARHQLQVALHVIGEFEVVYISSSGKKVAPKVIPEASLPRPERQWCVQVQAARPVRFPSERVSLSVGSYTSLMEAPQAQGSTQEEPVADTERLILAKPHQVACHAGPLQYLPGTIDKLERYNFQTNTNQQQTT